MGKVAHLMRFLMWQENGKKVYLASYYQLHGDMRYLSMAQFLRLLFDEFIHSRHAAGELSPLESLGSRREDKVDCSLWNTLEIGVLKNPLRSSLIE
jgi:hypothetical protein